MTEVLIITAEGGSSVTVAAGIRNNNDIRNKGDGRYIHVISFRIMLLLAWCRETLFPFARYIILRIPLINTAVDYVYPALMIIAAVGAFPYLVKKIRFTDLLIYMSMVTFVLLNAALFPSNSDYIFAAFGSTVSVMLLMFVGISIDYEENKKLLYFASLLGVVAQIIFTFIAPSGSAVDEERMNVAYVVLPSALYLIGYALEKKKARYWFAALLSFFMVLMCGTRGPAVITVVFLFAGILTVTFSNLTPKKFILTAVFFAVLVVLLTTTDVLKTVAETLSGWFEDLGLSTRIFDRILEEDFNESKGRERIVQIIMSAVKEHPIFGNGLMGDRFILLVNRGTAGYSHNIFLEFWCEYGVILGTAFIAAVTVPPVIAFVKCRNVGIRLMILVLFCASVLKLSFSQSYVYDGDFYMFLGYTVAVLRYCREKSDLRRTEYCLPAASASEP